MFRYTCTLIFTLICFAYSLIAQDFMPLKMRCEYNVNPVGIETLAPRLSWQLDASVDVHGVMQTAYRIQVAGDVKDLRKSRRLIWDSGRIVGDNSVHIAYAGEGLTSRQRCFWRVKVWDSQRGESQWSDIAQWEMGLLDSTEWTAQWIEPDLQEEAEAYNPCPMLRRDFELDKGIVKARLYITCHGLYQAYLNGRVVGDQLFTPGWTSYHHRLQYQIYDVTKLVQSGANAAGVILGDGWYRGQFGFGDAWNLYGTKSALLFQLEVTYKNGQTEVITSDQHWKASTGPIRMSNIYDGEFYDARLEKDGWAYPGYDDSVWGSVHTATHAKGHLVAPEGVPVRRIEELAAQEIMRTPEGDIVADLGQNMVGWVRLRVKGQPGDTIRLYHAEVLDKDGNFYTANLRSADQVVTYILGDDKERILEPHFTFQGFRYVKVEGFPGQPDTGNITGIVIHSDMEPTGTFECSNPMINQLQSNITWGQKGNFLDVPTDCPQRNERMGWTGDAQAFASTASFNFNTAAFYTKWLQDLKADQFENGSVPHVIPDVTGRAGAAGWADAATIIPWTMYLKYGDLRILERQYESMKNWVGYFEELSEGDYLVQEGRHFGDWLFFIHPTNWNAKPGHTDIDYIATAFFAWSTQLTLNTARLLNKEDDISYYSGLLDNIKQAFQAEYITLSGRLSPHSQTAYTLALAFDLAPDNLREAMADYLVRDIEARGFHLSTGFLGTPHLCHVLSSAGHTDVAYKLLLQETYPSWLYPVTRGATTIWERWDGIKPDSTFQDVAMNSFNHYAYGAIGDWMYRVVAGIEVDPEHPGYKHIVIQPHPTDDLTYARATYRSQYGEIASGWKNEGDSVLVDVTIPPNTTATIRIPHATLAGVSASGASLTDATGVVASRQSGDNVIVEVGSGAYTFSYPQGSE